MLETITNFMLNHTPLLYLTQSLWRDEAFSVFISKSSVLEIIRLTGGDFNPPLYYLLLHFWMKLFGSSEIALRSFSFVTFLVLVYVVFIFSKKIFNTQWISYFAATLTLTNPMLLYFAFELRMYSALALFATISMYALHQKKWKTYVIFSTAGLYTQPFMAFVLIAQSIYMLATSQFSKLFKPMLIIGALFLPWIPVLYSQLVASGSMWIWPIDAYLIRSALFNLYVGYEGTPPHLWNSMGILSLIFLLVSIVVLKNKKYLKHSTLFAIWTYAPLVLVLSISLIKPIYVHRYLIFVTVGEIFLITTFAAQYRMHRLTKIVASIFVLASLATNIYAAPFHKKVDFKKTFVEINTMWQKNDRVLADNPLNYYESLYYAKHAKAVYLYNPRNIAPPRFVGAIGMPQERWQREFPQFPSRAFLIHDNGSFDVVSSL